MGGIRAQFNSGSFMSLGAGMKWKEKIEVVFILRPKMFEIPLFLDVLAQLGLRRFFDLQIVDRNQSHKHIHSRECFNFGIITGPKRRKSVKMLYYYWNDEWKINKNRVDCLPQNANKCNWHSIKFLPFKNADYDCCYCLGSNNHIKYCQFIFTLLKDTSVASTDPETEQYWTWLNTKFQLKFVL